MANEPTQNSAIKEYEKLQKQAVEVLHEMLSDANHRRSELQRLYQEYRQKYQKSAQLHAFDQLDNATQEKQHNAYVSARKKLNTGAPLPTGTSEDAVRKIEGLEKELQRDFDTFQKEESQEGTEIKRELQAVKQEEEELKEISGLVEGSKGKVLSEADIDQINTLLQQVQHILEREIDLENFTVKLEAAERKLLQTMGNLLKEIKQFEYQ